MHTCMHTAHTHTHTHTHTHKECNERSNRPERQGSSRFNLRQFLFGLFLLLAPKTQPPTATVHSTARNDSWTVCRQRGTFVWKDGLAQAWKVFTWCVWRTRTRLCVYTHTYTHTHTMHAYMHTNTHAHTHVCTHTHANSNNLRTAKRTNLAADRRADFSLWAIAIATSDRIGCMLPWTATITISSAKASITIQTRYRQKQTGAWPSKYPMRGKTKAHFQKTRNQSDRDGKKEEVWRYFTPCAKHGKTALTPYTHTHHQPRVWNTNIPQWHKRRPHRAPCQRWCRQMQQVGWCGARRQNHPASRRSSTGQMNLDRSHLQVKSHG